MLVERISAGDGEVRVRLVRQQVRQKLQLQRRTLRLAKGRLQIPQRSYRRSSDSERSDLCAKALDKGQVRAVKKLVLHWNCIDIPSRSFYSHTDGYPQAFRKEVLMTKSL